MERRHQGEPNHTPGSIRLSAATAFPEWGAAPVRQRPVIFLWSNHGKQRKQRHHHRQPAVAGVVDESVAKKVALAALVGTALEWYDFFLFTTAAALVFNAQYFVSQDPFVSAMSSFATLAVGFVARPIGGFIFGALGDKVGRKKILMVTIVGIGVVTGLIGLLPELRDDRRRGPHHPGGPAHPAGTRGRRRVERRGDYRRRKRPGCQARTLRRPAADRLADRHHPVLRRLLRHALPGGPDQLRRLGLAHPVHCGDPAAGHLDVDPQQAQRVPGIRSPHGVRRDRARPHPRRPDEELAPDPGRHVLRAAGHRRLLPHHQLRGLLRHQGAQDALRNPAAGLAPRRRLRNLRPDLGRPHGREVRRQQGHPLGRRRLRRSSPSRSSWPSTPPTPPWSSWP